MGILSTTITVTRDRCRNKGFRRVGKDLTHFEAPVVLEPAHELWQLRKPSGSNRALSGDVCEHFVAKVYPLIRHFWFNISASAFETPTRSALGVRRDKAALSSGCKPHPVTLQPEATGAVMEVTKWLKPSDSGLRIGNRASVQAATRANAEQASKRSMCRPTR